MQDTQKPYTYQTKKRATRKKILFELPFIKNRRNKILIHDSQSFQCGSVMESIPDLLAQNNICIVDRVECDRAEFCRINFPSCKH